MPITKTGLRLALVGPCASGKSTLKLVLADCGYVVRMPVQEHSYVPSMWQQLSKPDLLIFLDVDVKQTAVRRPRNPSSIAYYAEQHRRLAHAREHCDFYLDTSTLSPEQVGERVLAFLQEADADFNC